MTNILRIELPLPPKERSPHAGKKQNVHKLARITREAHEYTIAMVREQMPRGKPLEKATVKFTFIKPTRGRRDKDNLIAAAKPYQDGLVLAGVIVDDSPDATEAPEEELKYRQRVRKPSLEVTRRR